MDWVYVGQESFMGSQSVDISIPLTRSVIAIDIDSPQKKSTWHRAGSCIQIMDLDFATGVELATSYTRLSFSPTVLKFELLSDNNYKLRFKPVPWLTEFTIKIWQYFGV